MKFAGSRAMREMDRYTIEVLGVPGEILMLRAAQGAAAEAVNLLQRRPGPVLVLCGSGNNGGDGIGIAALLTEQGYQVDCFLVGSREKLSEDSRAMLERLLAAGGELGDYPGVTVLGEKPYALIVDALFGTGLSRDIAGKYARLIDGVNERCIPILACDIPSGISADTGKVLGTAIHADVTVTFNLPKTGQLLSPGMEYTGHLVVHDIGIPAEAVERVETDGEFLTEDMVRSWLPESSLESHKGDLGKDLLVCGSRGFTGAAALAARACLRTGAGLVYLGTPESVYPIVAGKLDEPVVFPLPDEAGHLAETAVEALEQRLPGMDACLVGPGLGRNNGTEAVVRAALGQKQCPVVLDADGINVLSGHMDILDRAACPVVLTPHAGEFLRLGGDLSKGRIQAAKALSEATGAVVVLKGYRTVIAGPRGEVFVNATGNPGMATGGSGDVLSGVLTCLLGQGMEPVKAAAAAVWIHGAAGDRAAERYGRRSMLPGDTIACLSEVLRESEA